MGLIDDIIAAVETSHEEVAGPEEDRCEWCHTPYTSASALIACEIRCANDRGQE